MTGARVARAAARYLDGAQHFAVTYGDGLTNADLSEEVAFHLAHDAVGTVLAVNQPSQFGRLELNEDNVAGIREKPSPASEWINGGFFIFRRSFLDYLSTDDDCVLEREPLARIAAAGQLKVFRWGVLVMRRHRPRPAAGRGPVGVGSCAMAVLSRSNLVALARPMPGVVLLETRQREDERGWFARCFCREELRSLGVDRTVEQANMSSSARRGTLRGLHYQLGPSAETKIVSCLCGSVYRGSRPAYDLADFRQIFRCRAHADQPAHDGGAGRLRPRFSHARKQFDCLLSRLEGLRPGTGTRCALG